MATALRPLREQYLHFQPITTRWHDNDIYGHVNNVTYYAFFDTAVNTYLIERGGLDIQGGVVIKEVQDGPAAVIGLRPGDVITHLDNKAVTSTKVFADVAKALPKNRSVSMRVLRQGRASFITFKLAE